MFFFFQLASEVLYIQTNKPTNSIRLVTHNLDTIHSFYTTFTFFHFHPITLTVFMITCFIIFFLFLFLADLAFQNELLVLYYDCGFAYYYSRIYEINVRKKRELIMECIHFQGWVGCNNKYFFFFIVSTLWNNVKEKQKTKWSLLHKTNFI